MRRHEMSSQNQTLWNSVILIYTLEKMLSAFVLPQVKWDDCEYVQKVKSVPWIKFNKMIFKRSY